MAETSTVAILFLRNTLEINRPMADNGFATRYLPQRPQLIRPSLKIRNSGFFTDRGDVITRNLLSNETLPARVNRLAIPHWSGA